MEPQNCSQSSVSELFMRQEYFKMHGKINLILVLLLYLHCKFLACFTGLFVWLSWGNRFRLEYKQKYVWIVLFNSKLENYNCSGKIFRLSKLLYRIICDEIPENLISTGFITGPRKDLFNNIKFRHLHTILNVMYIIHTEKGVLLLKI